MLRKLYSSLPDQFFPDFRLVQNQLHRRGKLCRRIRVEVKSRIPGNLRQRAGSGREDREPGMERFEDGKSKALELTRKYHRGGCFEDNLQLLRRQKSEKMNLPGYPQILHDLVEHWPLRG